MSPVRNQIQPARVSGLHQFGGQAVMLLFLLGYWIIVWRLERIDYSDSPPTLWRRIISLYPLFDVFSPRILPLFEFFSFRVLRHFIPVVAGGYLAREAIKRLLVSFYDLREMSDGDDLLRRFESGRSRATPVRINRESFEKDRKRDPLIRIGGPGRISVSSGDAVVTEQNGRTVRVLGPGTHELKRFEYPEAVLDVRPQERETTNARLMTADGIELKTELSVTFQISPGKKKRSKKNPFPFDEEAVKKAAYAKTNMGEGKIATWEGLALGLTTGQLSGMVASRRLDELVFPEQSGVHIHRKLKMGMESGARDIGQKLGVLIRGTRLGSFEPPDSVKEQHLGYWRAYWDRLRRIQIAEGEADNLEEMEFARAQAEAMMLKAIVEGLQRAQKRGIVVKSREIVALRIIEALDLLARQSAEVAPLPENLLPALEELREQLLLGSSEDNEIGS